MPCTTAHAAKPRADPLPCTRQFPEIGYFGRYRFGYYRTSSLGHNVLRFDNEAQDAEGNAAIDQANLNHVEGPRARINLTGGYARGGARYVHRGFRFLDNFTVFCVRDEWQHELATTVQWVLHTPAQVTVDASKPHIATLTLDGVSLHVTVLSASGAHAVRLSAELLQLPPPQITPDPSVTVVIAEIAADAGGLTVTFGSSQAASAGTASVVPPLAMWEMSDASSRIGSSRLAKQTK